jgi:hypothetical protein
MANLTHRDRGQIILLAGFALAITFVALAVILNSVIFTENLASRGDTGGGTDALETRAMVENSVGADVRATNWYNYSSDSALTVGVQTAITNTSDQLALGQVTSGVITRMTFDSRTLGSRINQSDRTRMLTAADGSPDWPVVQDVERDGGENATRAFELNLTTGDLADVEGNAFRVTATEYKGSAFWQARIWDGTGDTVNVEVSRTGLPDRRCSLSVSDAAARISLTEGTIEDQPCRALRTTADGANYWFASGATERYNITFENGDEAVGTYSLVTRNSTIDTMAGSSPFVNSQDGAQPHATPALYSVRVLFDYQTQAIRYNTDIRVAPGEPDA